MKNIIGKIMNGTLKIKDPAKDQAKKELENITKMKYEDISWIQKDGHTYFAKDIDPILLVDLIKFGNWKAS